MAGFCRKLFVCALCLFLSIHALTPTAPTALVELPWAKQWLEHSIGSAFPKPLAKAKVQTSSLMRKKDEAPQEAPKEEASKEDPSQCRRQPLVSIKDACTITSVGGACTPPENIDGEQCGAAHGEGMDIILQGLDANTVEEREEEASALAYVLLGKSSADVLMAEEAAKKQLMHVWERYRESNATNGHLGADTWTEIADIVDSIPDEAIDSFTWRDIVRRLESHNKIVQNAEEFDNETVTNNGWLSNVEDTDRNLSSPEIWGNSDCQLVYSLFEELSA